MVGVCDEGLVKGGLVAEASFHAGYSEEPIDGLAAWCTPGTSGFWSASSVAIAEPNNVVEFCGAGLKHNRIDDGRHPMASPRQ